VNNIAADTTAPTINSFTIPATSSTLTVPISGLNASDSVGVSGYYISESATSPLANATGWSSSVPSNITFASPGSKTLYAFAKDSAGNVSSSRSATVVINLPDVTAPNLVSFRLPPTSKSLTVSVSGLNATDDVGVAGYLITESPTPPSASDSRWTSIAPTSFTFSAKGTRTAYAWAKDAAGNISTSLTATVRIR